MNNENAKCPEYKSRLDTANKLVNTVNTKIKDGTFQKKNLVWLELTGCSGNIISLLNSVNRQINIDKKY